MGLAGPAVVEAWPRNVLRIQLVNASLRGDKEMLAIATVAFYHTAMDTNAAWAYAGWGQAALAGDQPAEALPALKTAWRLDTSPIIGFELGQAQWALGYHDKAISTWRSVPRVRYYFLRRGDTALINGDLAEAEKAFTILALLEPHSAEALTYQGDVLYIQRRWDEAKQKYEAALAEDPTLARAHYRLGLLLSRDPSLDEVALSHLKRSILLDPHYTAYAYVNVGNIYRRQQAYEVAAKWYQLGIDEFPTGAVVWLHWAISKYMQANYLAALSYLEKAESLDSSWSLVYYWKGRNYYILGNYRQAVEAARWATRLQAAEETYNLLGDSYLALGQKDEAQYAYEKALLLNPADAHAARQLSEIQGK